MFAAGPAETTEASEPMASETVQSTQEILDLLSPHIMATMAARRVGSAVQLVPERRLCGRPRVKQYVLAQ